MAPHRRFGGSTVAQIFILLRRTTNYLSSAFLSSSFLSLPFSLLLSQSEKKVKLLQKNDLLLVAYLRPVRTSKQNPQKVKKYEFIHRKAEFFIFLLWSQRGPRPPKFLPATNWAKYACMRRAPKNRQHLTPQNLDLKILLWNLFSKPVRFFVNFLNI